MKFDDKIPIYYQIKQHLYHEILAGTLKPGDKLPAVRQLAIDLTVNVNTIQRALSEMITEKTIVSQRGKGNFVTDDTARLAELKEQLVMEQLALVYEQLHALNLSDAEILASLKRYIERKGAAQHD
ncbi:GntR family transcriptional regulator [Lactiplantibacillus mudanjiangensis]|uniref:GntR family transcriptional regulator [Lactobacillus sp.] n=1 Tax=Lactiplantibacillus mudanjiangensis TaxID=1296538 RepID=A0A660DV44_9LACO|nr:GntR family transcriptional regulator [Lactiplantibacillus mudanjiangensis]VDG18950.1 GntR family transcriptional regulator [Lactobacillus sp.] [Lactiplantibacillus mudanjiangensis]VDG25273.1 GntR family transcriptional regulator [Lactobacillus sp.] [Lactiplantibacillus mudanjiangensis]VDG27474.1 GntR family transcriptional regulator [Lactobacillus sp.] [Lactiplantibacillus mudanjiangensis]VDG33051.1 GntR family transcriptional regulator [Lactobacillus sp.] [Lactiplantibacillus mudanjiangens